MILRHLLDSHLTTLVQYIATKRTNSACNSGVSKKKREALMSGVCSFSFEGARVTLSAQGMCFAACRRSERKCDTAFRAASEPHVRALSWRRFPMPVPILAQQCATSPTLRTGGMQDIREPMRESIGKTAIANKWAWNWSYLRLQFHYFPHEPGIMTFPSPLLKHNNFLGVPPICMPPSASSFLTWSFNFPTATILCRWARSSPHQKPTMRPMPHHHGVPPYPPIGP